MNVRVNLRYSWVALYKCFYNSLSIYTDTQYSILIGVLELLLSYVLQLVVKAVARLIAHPPWFTHISSNTSKVMYWLPITSPNQGKCSHWCHLDLDPKYLSDSVHKPVYVCNLCSLLGHSISLSIGLGLPWRNVKHVVTIASPLGIASPSSLRAKLVAWISPSFSDSINAPLNGPYYKRCSLTL